MCSIKDVFIFQIKNYVFIHINIQIRLESNCEIPLCSSIIPYYNLSTATVCYNKFLSH